MNFNDMYPSKYLKKEDVPVPRTVTIKGVGQAVVGGEQGEEKNILYFHELKEMVLNKANAFTIFEAYGEPTNWPGKRVEVFSDPSVMFGGKRVGGLRLRVPSQNGQPPAQPSRDVWTLQTAIEQCWNAGIQKDELFAHLKSKGNAGYMGSRDTAIVQDFIRSRKKPEQEQGFDEPLPAPPGDASEIPF